MPQLSAVPSKMSHFVFAGSSVSKQTFSAGGKAQLLIFAKGEKCYTMKNIKKEHRWVLMRRNTRIQRENVKAILSKGAGVPQFGLRS